MSVVIVAIDTATVPFSIAIDVDGMTVAIIENEERTSLAGTITLMIKEGLNTAGLEMGAISAIAVNHGPGSYTGLRIGMAVAKGLCYALNIPLITLSGLKGIAHHIISSDDSIDSEVLICTALDARRDEVYLEVYNYRLDQLIEPTAVILPTELTALADFQNIGKVITAGDGGSKLLNNLGEYIYISSDIKNRADYLIPIAKIKYDAQDFGSVETSEPFYLKPPNITTPKAR